MTPSRMPDYRLPNKRGIVGHAAELLHCMRREIANALPCRQPGSSGETGPRVASPVAWLLAALAGLSAFVVGAPAVASGDDQLPSAGSACAAPQPTAGGQTSALLQLAADSLAAVIVHLRDTALQQGTESIPDAVRTQLQGFVPEDVLDSVRWRSDGPEGLSRSGVLSALGLVAVTVDIVVLFTDEEMAHSNPGIWAHELRHVMQYRACGVNGFALAYITAHDALEADARRYSLAWHQWTLDRWLEQLQASGSDQPHGQPDGLTD